MSWQLLTALSVLMFSISVLLRRVLLYHYKSDPLAYVIIFQGLVGILTGIYAIIHGFHAPDFTKYWLAILITSLLYAAAHIVSTRAFRQLEASVFSVLFATSAIWTMIAGLFLFNDQITSLQLAGVLLVFVSVSILVERTGLKIDIGTSLGLLTGMLFGLATAGWTYVGRHADVPSWTAISFLAPSLLLLVARPKSVLKMKPLLSGQLLGRMVLLGIIFSISSLASLFAYTKGNVNLVAALQQTSIIVTTLLAIVFLHERKSLWRKGIAASICFVAVLLIV
ncbi:MAG TPA: DMT family transporter [Candidatus Saccharimonadia bacterium]|nr:DMT family transporter [Candidatus Saccharimonadia bacterium]